MSRAIGVLFDYNGVLVDDEDVHEAAFRDVLAGMGVAMSTADYVKYCMGRTDVDGWRDLQQAFPDTVGREPIEALFRRKKAAYAAMVGNQDILYPDVLKVLENLAGEAAMALVTSALRDELAVVLGRYGLGRFFEGTVTADDVRMGKPDPEGYLRGLELLALPRTRVVVIEDSPSGVSAAKAAGLRCIAVLHTRREDELMEADRRVSTVGQVNLQLIRDVMST